MYWPNQDTFTMKADAVNNYTRTTGVNQTIICWLKKNPNRDDSNDLDFLTISPHL